MPRILRDILPFARRKPSSNKPNTCGRLRLASYILHLASCILHLATCILRPATWLTILAGSLLITACAGWGPNPLYAKTSGYAIAFAAASNSNTYYVRPDGGSAQQCTGLVDAPYPGSGQGQPCAWRHPFYALPPGGMPRIAGGDTLIIRAGSYMLGYGAPATESCSSDYPWDCTMPPIPSGPDPGHPTRILGESAPAGRAAVADPDAIGWQPGASSTVELWGTERAAFLINLKDASNVEIAGLELTDHASCAEFHTGGLACPRESYPFGPWAVVGIYAEDSANVYLHDLDIHGLAYAGIHAGRLRDWRVENVRLAGNGWAGWDGDLWEGGSANSGTLRFWHFTVEWNGCVESWPGRQPTGCWAQTAGGYGDGLGTADTGGQWIIEKSAFLHNTSDGLDLLYARLPGAAIEIRQTIAEGNAGNQIKTNGPVTIENSIIVGNCAYFQGKPFTFNVDPCRAYGNALDLTLRASNQAVLTNNTLTSQGDCLIVAGCEGTCNGSERIRLRNNLFQGHPDFLGGDQTCLAYEEDIPGDPFDFDYSAIAEVKDNACPGPHAICGVPLGLANPSISAFDAHLLAGSPAIDAGTSAGAPAVDFDGRPRDAHPDIGAYEYGAGPLPTASPTATATSTRTPTASVTATPTATLTRVLTATPTYTASPTRTPTVSPSRSATPSPTRTLTSTASATPTKTPTRTPTPSATATPITSPQPTSTPLLSAIEGVVWEDRNRDGRREGDEPGLPGLKVLLDPSLGREKGPAQAQEAVTDRYGHYRFDVVVPGDHIVQVEDPAVLWPTTPVTVMRATAWHETVQVDFGFFRPPVSLYLPVVCWRADLANVAQAFSLRKVVIQSGAEAPQCKPVS